MVRVAGIGRNEYIDTLNKCKAKKLLWRVSRAIAREHLPAEPLRLAKGDWWVAHVVNIGARRGGQLGAGARACAPRPPSLARARCAGRGPPQCCVQLADHGGSCWSGACAARVHRACTRRLWLPPAAPAFEQP